MKIDLIASEAMHTRAMAWYAKAANDPTVHRWWANDSSCRPPTDTSREGDWSSAMYMDEGDNGLLCISFNRVSHTGNVALYVLAGNVTVAAAMMRYFIKVLVKRYGLKSVAFAIAETNTEWADKMNKIASKYCWGLEPAALFDPVLGKWVSAYNFKILIEDGSDIEKLMRENLRTRKGR